jgi:putative nucleotidyltransferase with HDIG domain
MPEELMEILVARIDTLPPMPKSVLKLREAIASPDANYELVSAPLKEDPAICADLLRIANSARYGVPHKVDTVEEAVRYFGMPSLVEFVAAACSARIIREAFSNVKNLNEFALHSRTVAKAVSCVCAMMRMNPHAAESYSISGLLHDIGRLLTLLVTGEREFCKEAIGVYWDELSPEVASEMQIFGLNHAELGKMICEKWKFPARIVAAVHRHHTPIIKSDFSFDGMVIYMAEIMATEEIPDSMVSRAIPPGLMKELKIGPDDIIDARKGFMKELSKGI